jgi:hypothetical protein
MEVSAELEAELREVVRKVLIDSLLTIVAHPTAGEALTFPAVLRAAIQKEVDAETEAIAEMLNGLMRHHHQEMAAQPATEAGRMHGVLAAHFHKLRDSLRHRILYREKG